MNRIVKCSNCGRPSRVIAPSGTPLQKLLDMAHCLPGTHRVAAKPKPTAPPPRKKR